jgi:serine/threonine protein kinase
VGTVEYMPPEQVSSFQGDWWAFGCVVHYALTGRPPIFFDSESETDLATAFSRAVTFADQQGGSLLKDTGARQLVASLCTRSAGARPKDGGESMAFYEGFRPWSDLHKRTSPPALPNQRSGGISQGPKGPWQRRTFSTIHSPMPQAYTIDGGFAALCSGVCPRPILHFTLPSDWISDSTPMLKVLESYMGRIPKQRTLAPLDPSAARQGAPGAAKKMRTTHTATYNVAGIDLTAG